MNMTKWFSTGRKFLVWCNLRKKVFKMEARERLALYILRRLGLVGANAKGRRLSRIQPMLCGSCKNVVFTECDKSLLSDLLVVDECSCPKCGANVYSEEATLLDSFYLVRGFENTFHTAWKDYKESGEMKVLSGGNGLCYYVDSDVIFVDGLGHEFYL